MKTLTFAQTLHPEEAESCFNYQNMDSSTGSAWGKFFAEARGDIPVAIAYKVDEADDTGGSEYPQAMAPISKPDCTNEVDNTRVDQPVGRGCFYLEGVLGIAMTLLAAFATFGIELSAAICYCMAAGIQKLADRDVPILVRAVLLLIVHSLMIADAVLLIMSVLITELLGGLVFIMTAPLGGSCPIGEFWRVYIRKVCHLTRWAFRTFHDGWKPKRVFPIDLVSTPQQTSSTNMQGGGDGQFDEEAAEAAVEATSLQFADCKVVASDEIPTKKLSGCDC